MRSYLECLPCALRQGINTLRQADRGETAEELQILRQGIDPAVLFDLERSPAENSTHVLRKVMEGLGGSDPYARAKSESNQKALALLPALRERARSSSDPLGLALRAAAAGNIIDMGIVASYDLERTMEEVLERGLDRDETGTFRQHLAEAGRILILGDNSGEIAMDRFLCEVLVGMGVEVTYAVKGGPMLNDATWADAREVGLPEVARVIDNGSDYLGTVLSAVSPSFREAFDRAPLILAKGQANFETLEGKAEAGDRLFFLLRAKCPLVARQLGVETGHSVLMQNRLAVQEKGGKTHGRAAAGHL